MDLILLQRLFVVLFEWLLLNTSGGQYKQAFGTHSKVTTTAQ